MHYSLTYNYCMNEVSNYFHHPLYVATLSQVSYAPEYVYAVHFTPLGVSLKFVIV